VSGNGSLWGSAWQINASGLRDADLRMRVTANNVANGNTDGFVPDRVDSVALSNGGVDSVIISGEPLPDNLPADYHPPSQTDYATEGINLVLAQRAFEANVKSLKTQNSVTKTLIDEIA
jgi:flagellar basal-body rod protein FlgC